MLVYVGGIDDKASTSQRDIATAKKPCRRGARRVTQRQPVGTPSAMPYGGCEV